MSRLSMLAVTRSGILRVYLPGTAISLREENDFHLNFFEKQAKTIFSDMASEWEDQNVDMHKIRGRTRQPVQKRNCEAHRLIRNVNEVLALMLSALE